MPAPTSNPSARRAFVLSNFRVQGAKTPHGSPQTAKDLIPYCEEVVCEGLYSEVMEAVARQDPALSTVAGVSDDYLLWAADMTMYYFVISSLKARGVVDSLDATDYFTFQFPKPEKWVLAAAAEAEGVSGTAVFADWMARREAGGSKLSLGSQPFPSGNGAAAAGGMVGEEMYSAAVVDVVCEKMAARKQDDLDELVSFMNNVVL